MCVIDSLYLSLKKVSVGVMWEHKIHGILDIVFVTFLSLFWSQIQCVLELNKPRNILLNIL